MSLSSRDPDCYKAPRYSRALSDLTQVVGHSVNPLLEMPWEVKPWVEKEIWSKSLASHFPNFECSENPTLDKWWLNIRNFTLANHPPCLPRLAAVPYYSNISTNQNEWVASSRIPVLCAKNSGIVSSQKKKTRRSLRSYNRAFKS